MLLITYKRKAKLVNGHLRVDLPSPGTDLKQLITDMDYFRCKSKFQNFANSDMANSMLRRAIHELSDHRICFNPKYPPAGITVKYIKSAALPTVTVTIDLEFEPVASTEPTLHFNFHGNIPKLFGCKEEVINVYECNQSQIDKVEKLLSAGFSPWAHDVPLGLVYKMVDDELFTIHYQDALDAIDRGEYASDIFLSLVDGAA